MHDNKLGVKQSFSFILFLLGNVLFVCPVHITTIVKDYLQSFQCEVLFCALGVCFVTNAFGIA